MVLAIKTDVQNPKVHEIGGQGRLPCFYSWWSKLVAEAAEQALIAEDPCLVRSGPRSIMCSTDGASQKSHGGIRDMVLGLARVLGIPSARLTLRPTKLCTKFRIFWKKNFFGYKGYLWGIFMSISQNLKVTRLQGGRQTKLWTCWRSFDLSRSFERFFFWGLFVDFLCSSWWSDKKCCKTGCVALKKSFQTRPMRALSTHFLARYRFLKWGLKFRIFYKSLKIFNDLSWENHGHGGHEHGVRKGVFGGKLSFKKMSARGRLCTLQENPHLWAPTIKVRQPDGTYHNITCPCKTE